MAAKKRKTGKKKAGSQQEEGEGGDFVCGSSASPLSSTDLRTILQPVSSELLVEALVKAATDHEDVFEKVKRAADSDEAARKLFIRGIGTAAKASDLEDAFGVHGELEDVRVVMDKSSGKNKGYGFVTFKHAEDALKALRAPGKTIDGRVSICQLASVGPAKPAEITEDQSLRKIYVGNLPPDTTSQQLLDIFSEFGELDKGPLGFDKQTGKCRGYALFLYKSAADARRAVQVPVKELGGRKIQCKMADDGPKQADGAVAHLGLGLQTGFGPLGLAGSNHLGLAGSNPLGLAGSNPLGLAGSNPLLSQFPESIASSSLYDPYSLATPYSSQIQSLGSSQSGPYYGESGLFQNPSLQAGLGSHHSITSLALARAQQQYSYLL